MTLSRYGVGVELRRIGHSEARPVIREQPDRRRRPRNIVGPEVSQCLGSAPGHRACVCRASVVNF